MSELSETVLVIGLGSPIVSDDRVGLEIVKQIESMKLDSVETRQEAIGGLDILPLIFGYRHVIIVDAIQSGSCPPGTVMLFDIKDFEHTVADSSAHGINLATAIALGRQLETERMPEEVRLVAIEAQDLLTVSEEMSAAVENAVPKAVSLILELISEFKGSYVE